MQRVDGGVDPPLFGGGARKAHAGVRSLALEVSSGCAPVLRTAGRLDRGCLGLGSHLEATAEDHGGGRGAEAARSSAARAPR